MPQTKLFFWLAILWTVLIVIGLTIPGGALPYGSLWEFDKLIHFGLFLVLTVLWLEAMAFGRISRSIMILALIVAFSFLSEVYQQLLPFERTADIFDAVADSIGAGVGFVIWGIKNAFWPNASPTKN